MADRAACKATLQAYIERSTTDGTLKLSPMKKCMIELGLKQYTTTLETSIWNVHADKAKKNCSIDKILDVMIPALAEYESKSKKGKSKDDIVKDIMDALAKGKPQAKQASGGSKADAVTARMTDAKGYTGSHKERFDESGKGKGKDGRVDKVDGSGYVGNYKGANTYDQTH